MNPVKGKFIKKNYCKFRAYRKLYVLFIYYVIDKWELIGYYFKVN